MDDANTFDAAQPITVLPQLDPLRNRVEKQVFPACLLGHFYRAHEGTAMKQDGKEFSPANDAMLQQAADGELVLWAFIRRHTAKLCAFPWAVAPKQATRGCAAGLVPTMPELANDMLGFPGTTLKNYLATDPTDCLESHPWKDHYWVLDEPQAVTREQVYFQQPARKAAPVVAVDALVAKSGPVLTAPAQCNSTKTPRSDSIDPVIALAKAKCRDPNDTNQVWPQMQVLADSEQAPFLASTPKGLKYHKNGMDAYFTRDALDKRLHPEKRKGPAARR